MQLHAVQLLVLVDAQQREIGQITVERTERELVFGRFAPGPAWPAVSRLFKDFEEAVNSQALALVDELDAAIAAMGLDVRADCDGERVEVHDVQIWSDGTVTFRLRPPAVPAVETGQQSADFHQPVRG